MCGNRCSECVKHQRIVIVIPDYIADNPSVIQIQDSTEIDFLDLNANIVLEFSNIYPFLGEPISPTINRTKTLMIKAGRETFAFFGSGIDMTDEEIDITYRGLLDSYNLLQKQKEEQKALDKGRPLIQLPKIELPKISIPFLGINIGGAQKEPEKAEATKDSTVEITETEQNKS